MAKDGKKDPGSKAFLVRRKEVLDALYWLKAHNHLYSDIEIIEHNLDWIEDGIEQDLPNVVEEDADENEKEKEMDMGPSPDQVFDVLEEEEYTEEVSGSIPGSRCALPGVKDKAVTEGIQKSIDKCQKKKGSKCEINWPYVDPVATDEYAIGINLFPKAFPWLFPGGQGDYASFQQDSLTLNEWIRRMTFYKDGRFAKDKFWCFYALNFALRHRNNSQGSFFVDGFYADKEMTLPKLQEQIENGNTQWIDQITYYAKNVRGSAAFWRSKKAEVYSWINHHVQKEHGAPHFFITLSCAEYHWPDVKRLLTERLQIAGKYKGEKDMDDNYVKYINEYTLVVQEYFQQRVELWLKTIGKTVFGIKHYWVRYEFAASRGQIHAHMLVITDNIKVYDIYSKLNTKPDLQAEFLRLWVEKRMNMVNTYLTDEEIQNFKKTKGEHPAKILYQDVEDDEDDIKKCQVYMQQHVCNPYCMRKRKHL